MVGLTSVLIIFFFFKSPWELGSMRDSSQKDMPKLKWTESFSPSGGQVPTKVLSRRKCDTSYLTGKGSHHSPLASLKREVFVSDKQTEALHWWRLMGNFTHLSCSHDLNQQRGSGLETCCFGKLPNKAKCTLLCSALYHVVNQMNSMRPPTTLFYSEYKNHPLQVLCN